MKKALYPGSFDPITNGHLDVIRRSLKIFDHVVVLIGNHPQKKSLFSVTQRIEMTKEVLKNEKNISVDSFDGLLLDYAKQHNIPTIIRGLRAVSDFDYEFQRALLNRKLNDSIDSIFIMTKDEYSFLTSSIVKEIAQFGGSVEAFVPKPVEQALRTRFRDE